MVAASAAANCITDTSQADFQSGTATNVDLAATAGSVVLARSSGGGGGTVDQQNTSFQANGELMSVTQWAAQTFTPSRSGALTQVDVNIFCQFCSATPPKVVVSIRATSGGKPTGADLASTTLTYVGPGQTWNTATFSAPMTVSAGTQYALVLRPQTALAQGAYAFSDTAVNSFTGNDVYPGGAIYFTKDSGSTWTMETAPKPSVDGAFKVYVGSGGSSGYLPAGDLISSGKDSAPPSGSSTVWDTLSWNGTTPTGTSLKFQVAASNSSGGPFTFVGPDGTANSYFTSAGASLDRFSGNRYLKYRAFLASSSTSNTPVLADATVCYSTSTPSADLSITVDDGVTSATPGQSVTYQIVAHNAGPNSVSSATVSDTFPSALTCSWTCAGSGGGSCPASGNGSINASVNLPSGANASFTATCSISPSASGTLTNTATVSTTAVADPASGNNSDADSDTLSASTNVALSMSDDVDLVRIGDLVDYVITLTNNNGPSNASVSITDTLPSQLDGNNATWVCSATNGASCGSSSGRGVKLTDSATLPNGGKVTYIYSATVLSQNRDGQVSNAVAAKVMSGGNQASQNLSANDSDIVVIFAGGFEGGSAKTVSMKTTGGAGSGSITATFGVDAGLLNRLPASTPITVATGTSTSGRTLFSVQLVRLGSDIAMRTLTTIDDTAFSVVSPWQVVDMKSHAFGLSWQSATTRGDDGFLSVAGLPLSANNARESLAALRVAVEHDVAWLVPITP
jgi:uncharacterized repeat protein (TIGR01451 family)/fimbrial isopeptide formation D2 family protein